MALMPPSAPALWTKHRSVAYGLAHDFRIDGLERQDVEQEALIALWEACRGFDKRKGRFPTFAKTVIRRHLTDLLRSATALKRTAELQRDTDVPARDEREGREQLALLVDALPSLTPRERHAVRDHLHGHPSRTNKAHDQALYRARAKLRSVA